MYEYSDFDILGCTSNGENGSVHSLSMIDCQSDILV